MTEGVPEKVMLTDQATYFIQLHGSDFSEVEMHFLTKQHLSYLLMVYIKECSHTIVSQCEPPTQANTDIFFLPTSSPNEQTKKLLDLNSICRKTKSATNYNSNSNNSSSNGE